MKNVIFDLAGVLFDFDHQKRGADFVKLFSFVVDDKMPHFWEAYDKGNITKAEVIEELSAMKGVDCDICRNHLDVAINIQTLVEPTARLIEELKAKGYKLYVLSNMAKEFIEFLRLSPIFQCFDGEIISCEVHAAKPEKLIYTTLLERYNLDPSESLFIDDRAINIEAAKSVGINTFQFNPRAKEESCDQIREMLYH